ncbi:MAG: thioredoxin family protein [Paracoccaceae bacterium]|nr:thioredoxin family protein [Paracoccaceae bacterium]
MRALIVVLFSTLISVAPAFAETTMGDDGLHKAEWMHDTFKDLREDLEEATSQGKRFAIIIEQRGCAYCKKMHETVFPEPEINFLLNEDYFFVQINMFGDVEIIDFDGEELSERDAIQKWGVMFTPTILFFPEEVPQDVPANRAAVAYIPGAFSKGMTLNMLNWVLEHGYEGEENFQAYHARISYGG